MTAPAGGGRTRIAAVVVNFNYERFLVAAVTSVLEQTDPFDEVIVVDDGSTDDSLSVLEQFGDRIRIIAKTNGGPLSAAWAAVAETECTYFYLLDADDRATPQLVETVMPLLAARPVKVQFQLRSMNVDGLAIDSVFPSYSQAYASEHMIQDNQRLGFYVCAPTSGNVFRTDYLEFLRTKSLDEREAYDGVPAQLAPYFGEVVSLNIPLAHYRVHETSLSGWSKPTPRLMERELARFENRWAQALRVLDEEGLPAPDPTKSSFVAERELMGHVLTGRRPRVRTAARYVASEMRSRRSLPHRVAFSLWGIALVILPRKNAADLVYSRRSVGRRGRLSSTIARLARARTRSAAASG